MRPEMLTPEEQDSLRTEMREAADYGLKVFREEVDKIATPSRIAAAEIVQTSPNSAAVSEWLEGLPRMRWDPAPWCPELLPWSRPPE